MVMRGCVYVPILIRNLAVIGVVLAAHSNAQTASPLVIIAPRDTPTSILLVVGSLIDGEGICEVAPPDVVHVKPTLNDCTLRTAIAFSNAQPASTSVTILVRSGVIRLSAPLPEVTGIVQIIGSATATAVTASKSGEDHAEGADPSLHDAGYDAAAAAAGLAGQTSPIGTVLDGGGVLQILRAAVGSAVHLATLRVERGKAWSHNGGCISSRGTLVLNNVALRFCEAAYGGAIYSDGDFEAHHSLLEHNTASHCGGALYAALTGKAHINK